MQIGMTVGGDVLARPSSPIEIVTDAQQAEREGYATVRSVHFSRAYDALTTLSLAHQAAYRVDCGFTVPGTSEVSVLVGALWPQMLRAAGEVSDGVVTWLAGLRTLAAMIIPALHDASTHRPAPRVAALPVAVTDDPLATRATDEQAFGRYNGMENYRRLFAREGVTSVADLALVGTEDEVATQCYADLGATELWSAAYPVGDDPETSTRRTRALLTALADL